MRGKWLESVAILVVRNLSTAVLGAAGSLFCAVCSKFGMHRRQGLTPLIWNHYREQSRVLAL